MSDGVKIRAQVHAESVGNVIFVNGGGSVALIALLPSVIGTPLFVAVLCTLSIWGFGLIFALIHSLLHIKCSLALDRNNKRPHPDANKLATNTRLPWACWGSRVCLNSSIIAFVCGVITMVAISFWHLGVLTEERNPSDPLTLESIRPMENRSSSS